VSRAIAYSKKFSAGAVLSEFALRGATGISEYEEHGALSMILTSGDNGIGPGIASDVSIDFRLISRCSAFLTASFLESKRTFCCLRRISF
jgi:hypothetical protein